MMFWVVLCIVFQPLCGSLAEQWEKTGYLEMNVNNHEEQTYDDLYNCFDKLVDFLQANRGWAQKLYSAKERFIRSKERHLYSTDFFGFYDESKREGRKQISFYYSLHFHKFVVTQFPDIQKISPIKDFFEACFEIQKPLGRIFYDTAMELGIEIFDGPPPLLFKVIKYLPSYSCSRPHYDGTAFSLFLHSTDNQSLLVSPYKSAFTASDFSSPLRELSPSSILLIPGIFLTEFSIYPTPHIVLQNGKTRYASIAFAMRSHYTPKYFEFSHLPQFEIE